MLCMEKTKIFYSITEVAKLLHVTRQAIFDRIQRGTLKAQKIGATYVISKKEVRRLQIVEC